MKSRLKTKQHVCIYFSWIVKTQKSWIIVIFTTAVRFIWLCRVCASWASALTASGWTMEVVLSARAPEAAAVCGTVKPDNVKKYFRCWRCRWVMTGTNNPSQDFHPHSSVDMVASTPFHCWTWKYTHKLWYVAAPEVGGKFCGKCLWLPFGNIVGI